jgi:hypothetical protein
MPNAQSFDPAGKEDWTCTDPDTGQYVRQVDRWTFEVYEGAKHAASYKPSLGTYTLEDKTISELDEIVEGYYESIEQVFETYGEGWAQVVAEIMSEKDAAKQQHRSISQV